jgi:hypothetical protein
MSWPSPVVSRPVKRLTLNLLTLIIAWLCSACLASSNGSLYDNPRPARPHPSASGPTVSSEPTAPSQPTVTSQATASPKPERKTLAFGKSHTWEDGVTLTVGKPKKFEPSKWAFVQKSKQYVKFSITVVNKSNKRIDIGLTAISVHSLSKEEDQLLDSVSGLKGPPDSKLSKGRKSEFDVGFGVADPKNIVMEVVLHDEVGRRSLLYST